MLFSETLFLNSQQPPVLTTSTVAYLPTASVTAERDSLTLPQAAVGRKRRAEAKQATASSDANATARAKLPPRALMQLYVANFQL